MRTSTWLGRDGRRDKTAMAGRGVPQAAEGQAGHLTYRLNNWRGRTPPFFARNTRLRDMTRESRRDGITWHS